MRSTVVPFVFGGICGTVFFFTSYVLLDWSKVLSKDDPNFQMRALSEYRHSGIVVHHDMQAKTLVLREQTAFHVGTTTGELLFMYDDATEWSSREFEFRDNILERRRVQENERERQLPEGARVILARDPTVPSPWRIASISFLRRIEL